MEWSTTTIDVDRPFGSWADDLASAFVQLEPRKLADGRFRGAITKADAGPIQISRVKASKHRVLRQPCHIARGGAEVCFVNLQLQGLACSIQRGHEQICGPGDLAVVDTSEPFEIANSRDFVLLCFAVPRDVLPKYYTDRPRMTLSTSDSGRALARTLAGYADLLLGSTTASSSVLGTHVLELLRHADTVLPEAPEARVSESVQLAMMLDHIDRHFADPHLSATTLAGKFGYSPRYVHKLFSATGRSFGDHVNDRRILACARTLLDPDRRRMTIAEIAFANGFRDISNFNRLFKSSNGRSPREYRRSMAGQTGPGAL